MLKKLLKTVTEGATYLGLEFYHLDGQDYFSLLKLENKKGELEVVLEKNTNKLLDLLPEIDKKVPLFVTFNTSQVLKKQVGVEAKNNPELLVINAFPNLELDNFYYQVLSGNTDSVVSICKKAHLNSYLEQLAKIGVDPTQVALGISCSQMLVGILEGNLKGSNFELHLSKSSFDGFKNSNDDQNIPQDLNGTLLGNKQLLSFAQILSYLNQKVHPSNLRELNDRLKIEFKNLKLFDFGVKFSLGFFLVVLLANFLVFNHFHSENLELEINLSTEVYQDNSIGELKERVAVKEERLQTLKNSKNSKVSYYLDELGKSVPKSIYLSEMQFQPLLFPVRKDKAIELNKHSLQLSGVTNDKVEFTVWSDNLETQKWIKQVEIMDYEYLSNSSANFSLNLILNETE